MASPLTAYDRHFVSKLQELLDRIDTWINAQHRRDGNVADRICTETEAFCKRLANQGPLDEDACYQLFDMAMAAGAIAVTKKLRRDTPEIRIAISTYQEDLEKARTPTPVGIGDTLWKDTQHLFCALAEMRSEEAKANLKKEGNQDSAHPATDAQKTLQKRLRAVAGVHAGALKHIPPEKKAQAINQIMKQRVIMISGCEDTQTSADVSNTNQFGIPKVDGAGKQGGACTSSLLHVFYDKVAQGDQSMSWADMLSQMRQFLKAHDYKQVPMMSSNKEKGVLDAPFGFVEHASCRKRAVFVGINYVGDNEAELSGCQNDALKMKDILTKFYGFHDDHSSMKVLIDDGQHISPTHENIVAAMDWLTQKAQDGDELYFHYSGHGVQIPDDDGDEKDGKDEAMAPVDFRKTSMIRDDDVFQHLVLNLGEVNARLFCLMDCCHSGSIMDLPYTCKSGDDPRAAKMVANEGFDVGKAACSYHHGNFAKAFAKPSPFLGL